MNDEQMLEEKQTYLQQEIVEKNFDTSDFLVYLTDLKGEQGIDINYWSFPELKLVNVFLIIKVVEEFQKNCIINHQFMTEEDSNAYERRKSSIFERRKSSIFRQPSVHIPKQVIKEEKENNNLNKQEEKVFSINNYNPNEVKQVKERKLINPNNSSSNIYIISSNSNIVSRNLNEADNLKNNDIDEIPVTQSRRYTTTKSFNEKKVKENKSKTEENEEGMFEKTINCVMLEKSVLTDPNIKLNISSPEKQAGGFFSSDYITYLITTEPHNFKVRRRYSDFEWLRNILLEFFPGFMIPPIPSKNYGERLHDDFIHKRMRYLEVIIKINIRNS